MKEHIDALVEGLQNLRGQLDEHDDLTDRVEKANTDLEMTNAQLVNAREQLKSSAAALSAAQVKASEEHNSEIFRKQSILKSLVDRITTAEQHLAEVQTKTDSAQQRHDQILASLDSLKAKFG